MPPEPPTPGLSRPTSLLREASPWLHGPGLQVYTGCLLPNELCMEWARSKSQSPSPGRPCSQQTGMHGLWVFPAKHTREQGHQPHCS